MGEVDEMKKGAAWVAIVAVGIELGTGLSVAAAEKVLPAGGGQNVACLDYGVEMRNGKEVKSCLLAAPGDFPAAGGQTIACAAKYSIAFRTDGKVEYCTLSKDMEFRRTAQEKIGCQAGGRVAFYPDGTVEVARLKQSMHLPYDKNKQVACQAGAPVTFRADGQVATCMLAEASLFLEGSKKKPTASACQVGGLIAFDEFGAFNGCYPPPAPKTTEKPAKQGGQTK